MRIGINGSGLVASASIDKILASARQTAEDGLSSFWLPEHPTGGLDALSVLTIVGQQVPHLELGTAIIATFPRHPMVLAGQVHTLRGIIENNFTLGIGLSHEVMMAQLGIPFEKPIRHLKEYLSIIVPLLNQGKVSFTGQLISCEAEIFDRPKVSTPVVVAALGPQALAIAGSLSDGTTLSWVGPRTVKDHIKPRLAEAASKANRPTPRIIATLPICVTDDESRIRSHISKSLHNYTQMPSYRAMFEREGAEEAGELALVGSRAKVENLLHELSLAGVTDFAAAEYTTNALEREQTRALLREWFIGDSLLNSELRPIS